MSPFGDLGPRGKPPRSKIEKSITRSMLVSAVRQTCTTITDRVCCEKHSDAWSVTAGVVNYLCFAVIGDQQSACGDIRQFRQLAYLFLFSSESVISKLSQATKFNIESSKYKGGSKSSLSNLLVMNGIDK